jgi:hypothetical protein
MKITFENEADMDLFCDSFVKLLVDLGVSKSSFQVKALVLRFLFNLNMSIEEAQDA